MLRSLLQKKSFWKITPGNYDSTQILHYKLINSGK